MRRIAFHYSVFNRGGAEKSTLRLMKLFVKNGWDVTLILNFRGGNMELEIPEEIHKVYLSAAPIERYQTNKLHRVLLRMIDALHAVWVGAKLHFQKFDMACVGLQGLNPFLVCHILRAKKRLLFVRNDLMKLGSNQHIKSNLRRYGERIDYLICVSGTAKASAESLAPELAHKARVIYNVLDRKEMLQRLEVEENPIKPSICPKLVTVCRMNDKAKALFRSLEVCEELFGHGYCFDWYFVGDGADLDSLKRYIRGKKCEPHIFFEGARANPFPYYKNADIVAVLSYYEGLCGVVNEAKVAGAAVLATEFSGIHEQLTHGENGWIVGNDKESIAEGLKFLLDHPETVQKMHNTHYPEAILNDDYKFEQFLALQ